MLQNIREGQGGMLQYQIKKILLASTAILIDFIGIKVFRISSIVMNLCVKQITC